MFLSCYRGWHHQTCIICSWNLIFDKHRFNTPFVSAVIKLDKMSGSLSAYGKEELYITYQPLSQVTYNVKVMCTINNHQETLLTIAGNGVFPKLSFIDVRSVG